MNRATLYARYSSDLQSASSIADQMRALRGALPRLGLTEVAERSDAAISGASWARPGLEAALADVESGRADVLLAEALDRISRDLEHVARIAKRVAFRGARIVTLSEGEIGALHIGLSGTMAQLYLEQLAEKTRRGLRGVVADGRIAAGRAYGYQPTAVPGVFEIVAAEANIVRRIFSDYAGGCSPRAIAHALNAEGVPGPRGGAWKGNTILGDRASAAGIINNRIYVGEIVWNRSTWRKDPTTGKRRPFPLPESEWIVTLAPQLRIVPDELWALVRRRQGDFVERGKIRRATRPLSGLLVCGACGAKLTIVGRDRYGCPVHKEQGTCPNGRTAVAQDIERRVLDGLRSNLCTPEAVAAYTEAYVAERKRLRGEAAAEERRIAKALAEAERKREQILEAIEVAPAAALATLATRLGEVAEQISGIEARRAALPGAGDVIDIGHMSADYLARNLDRLWDQLMGEPASAAEAQIALSALIGRIVVAPAEARGAYELIVVGDVAAFMGLGFKKPLVAGAGFEPAAFRL